MFEVTSINTDRSLLTRAELRAAANVTDGSRDAALLTLGNYISATITSACRIATDGATPANLRLETLADTFRSSYSRDSRHWYRAGSHHHLYLSRRPIVTMISVIENDVALDPAADFLLNKSAGLLTRLSGDREICWPYGTIAVAYTAGWATVPDLLKFAATKFIQVVLAQAGRDPFLTFLRIEGVAEYRYWVDPTKDSIIPAEVMEILDRGGFVNEWAG